ncbi:dTMP kinase [Sphingomonas daechungensis]|uniref:Thymidylate kinase n=1 Tax=Sphingomonas daechungensis TaxID=1176646 RepID=A0ABX6SYU6_9SPHN|nr:dTMP kinase [Sphingomonas daechungensis]QNP42605.1 dTMP kinase [Sphingomonas daechungensis]
MSDGPRFITLEGGEGVGKSTQLKALHAALAERGLHCAITREPGGSEGAEAIRALVLSGDDSRWSSEAEALLFAAARADHVEKTIRPALEQGHWVLSDRFLDSSLAYQGGALGLGVERVRELYRFACGDFLPDRTLVLVLDEGAERARARDTEGSDRIGGRSDAFHRAVDVAFRQIAAQEPDRVRLIDASGTPQDVTARLLDNLADLLP